MTDDAIDAARRLLPWWVPWANVLLLVPIAALLSMAVTWTAAFVASRPLRKASRAGPLAWHERARLAWPLERAVKKVAFVTLLMVPAIAFLAGSPFSRVTGGWLWLLLLAVVFRSIRLATRPFRSPRRAPPLSWKQWLKALLFALLLFAQLPVIVAMALFVGPHFDRTNAIAAALGLAALAALSAGAWLWIARQARILRPPSARLLEAVRGAAARIGIPLPVVLEADLPVANAFAVPRQQLLVVTSRALALLDDDELAAICSHELGHLTEPRAALLLRALAIVALLPIAFVQPIAALFEGHVPFPPYRLAFALGIALAFSLIAAIAIRIALRHLEGRADAIAHAHEGGTGAYVRALAKLHRESRMPLTFTRDPTRKPGLLRRLFAHDVHGSFAERVVALGATLPPDLKPPSRLRFVAAVAVGLTFLVVGLASAVELLFDPRAALPEHETTLELAIGLEPAPDYAIGLLARRRLQRGALDEAIVLARAGIALGSGWPPTLALFADSLIDGGLLDEAAATLDRAERICESYREDGDDGDDGADYGSEVRAARAKLEARRAGER